MPLMFLDLSSINIYIKPGPTDMRKQSAGLSVIVQEEMEQNPLSKSLFVFCNRRRTLIKAIYWDRNGFCLWQKRLEKDTFPWPSDQDQVHTITYQQWKLLLDGLNIWKAHTEKNFIFSA